MKDFKNRNIKDQAWIVIGNELKERGKFVSKKKKKKTLSNIPINSVLIQ